MLVTSSTRAEMLTIVKRYRFRASLVLICTIAGVAIARDPLVGLIAAGLLLFTGSLEFGPTFLTGAALFLVAASRLLQIAGVPRLVNFLHFALIVEALIASHLPRTAPPVFSVRLERLLAISLVLCLISWVLSGGELLRPILAWLVLYEPFIVIVAVTRQPPSGAARARITLLLAAIVFVQLPFAVYEYRLGHGDADTIQGTFIGAGAGAHVAGGVALMGSLFCLAKALTSKGRIKLAAFLSAFGLFVFPVVADAKQAIVCFLPGFLLVIVVCRPGSLTRLWKPAAVVILMFTWAYITNPALEGVANLDTLRLGIAGKIAGYRVLASHMNRRPGGWLLGLGPGNSISRIAVLAHEAPLQAVGMKVSPITNDLLDVSRHNYMWGSSSAWSPISSWAGIFGDLGVLGLIAYICMFGFVWRELRRSNNWQNVAAAATMISAALLGLVYSWLEEPGFMLTVAAAAGIAITQTKALRPIAVKGARVLPAPAYSLRAAAVATTSRDFPISRSTG